MYKTPRLKRDDIGVSVFPSLDIHQILASPEREHTKRIKRREVISEPLIIEGHKEASTTSLDISGFETDQPDKSELPATT
ncbi:Hypothetical predicted protein, partial [Paramuricea clavata]